MKKNWCILVSMIILLVVFSVTDTARADMLGKEEAQKAFRELKEGAGDKGGPPLNRTEVENAKGNSQQVSDLVSPILDLDDDLSNMETAINGLVEILTVLEVVPYVGPVARDFKPFVKKSFELEQAIQGKVELVVPPAKYLNKTASTVEKSMNWSLGRYYVYDVRNKVNGWEFPEYGLGGGMNYSCFTDEMGDYKRHLLPDIESVNNYLNDINGPVTGFNTSYAKLSSEMNKFKDIVSPVTRLSSHLQEADKVFEDINRVLNKKVGFTIDPKEIYDHKLKITIDFVPQEVYDKKIDHEFDFDIKIFGWDVAHKSFTVELSVNDIVHGTVDIEDEILQKTVDIVADAIPNYPRDGKIDYNFDFSIKVFSHSIGKSFRVEFSVKDVLEGSANIEEEILDKAVDYVWEALEHLHIPFLHKDKVRDEVKKALGSSIRDAVNWIENKAKDLEISRDDIKSEIKKIIGSTIDQAADDIKDKADQLVKDAEMHFDVEVSIGTLVNSTADEIQKDILTYVPDKWKPEVEKYANLKKYVKELTDQIGKVGKVDIELSVEDVLKEATRLEDKILDYVSDDLDWIVKQFGLKDAADKIEKLAKEEVDTLVKKITDPIIPDYKELTGVVDDLQAPFKALKHDATQIIEETLPTIDRSYYEKNDLKSLTSQCHSDYWLN